MAQRNGLAEKVRVTWDGEEIPGLVSVSETKYSKGVIEIPEYHRKRRIQDGILTFSDITMVYSLKKDSKALAFFRDFFFKEETHTGMRIRTDASGAEFGRTMLQDCVCIDMTDPETDLASPTYAKVTVVFSPWEVVPMKEEA